MCLALLLSSFQVFSDQVGGGERAAGLASCLFFVFLANFKVSLLSSTDSRHCRWRALFLIASQTKFLRSVLDFKIPVVVFV